VLTLIHFFFFFFFFLLHQGHRITAMTQLPIKGSETLIYGSDDAGTECTVNNKIPSWSMFIRDASMGLNLKPHWVVNGRSAGGEIELASCVDLEGHSGSDGRMYLLDFSRTFPPAFKPKEACEAHDQLWPFYHMMRAEFVARWEKPLCADSYSNFQSRLTSERAEEAKNNNREVRAATEALMTETVMRVCKALIDSSDSTLSITHVFHRFGLNMRYLGLVYQQLVSKSMYSKDRHNLYMIVQMEAIMRVFKNHLRSQLRKTQMQTEKEDCESRLLAVAAETLNSFFGHEETFGKWRERNAMVVPRLVADFNFSEKHANHSMDSFFRSYSVREFSASGQTDKAPIKYAVLARLNVKAGLGLSPTLLQELLTSDKLGGRSFLHSVVFEDLDFKFEESIKNLDVVERATGVRLYLKGLEAIRESNWLAGQENLMRALHVLEAAIEANPSDLFLCLLMGDICRAIADTLRNAPTKAEESAKLLVVFRDRAGNYYHQACMVDASCQPAQSKLGIHYAQAGRLKEAQEALLRAIELSLSQSLPADQAALWELANVLEQSGEVEKAERLREEFKHFSGLRDQWLAKQLANEESVSTVTKRSPTEETDGSKFVARPGRGIRSSKSAQNLTSSGNMAVPAEEELSGSKRTVKTLFSDKRREASRGSLEDEERKRATKPVAKNSSPQSGESPVLRRSAVPTAPRGEVRLSDSGNNPNPRIITPARAGSNASSMIEEEGEESGGSGGGNKFSRFMKKKLGK
jgi:tetratricopeptide (TPR) repeat protein